MKIYQLMHIFYRFKGEVILSPKTLGIYSSLESIQKAISYFNKCPGFRKNTDGYSVTCHDVIGDVINDTVYEVMVYFHDDDYETEYNVNLGFYGSYNKAQEILSAYCDQNKKLFHVDGLTAEKTLNKCIIGQKTWEEGFVVVYKDSATGEIKEIDEEDKGRLTIKSQTLKLPQNALRRQEN